MSENKQSIYDFTRAELQEELTSRGLSRFVADQVYDWIYRKYQFDLGTWSNVSKKTKSFLQENYSLVAPKIAWHGLSKDGTRKFLVAMNDGNTVEAVAIPSRNRLTLCISSQVGCAIGCTFCHTGTMGLKRHLKAGEIVGQFLAVSRWLIDHASQDERLTNIVYMGQGEPLHNFEQVKKATINFIEPKGIGFGQRRITLSTSGLCPQIEKLVDFPPVNIAISLHSAKNDVRTELMPINKVYNLERLFKAIKSIPLKANRRITYEYLLIDGLNDTPEDVEALAKLLEQKESKINLIPFNEYPESSFKRPSPEKVNWFRDQMMKKGFCCTIRATKGDDILAACGQLKSAQEKKLNLWQETELQESYSYFQ